MAKRRLHQNLVIQPHKPENTKLKQFLLLALIILLNIASFILGQHLQAIDDGNLSSEVEKLSDLVDKKISQNEMLERKLTIAQRESQVANTARKELSHWLEANKHELQQSQDELDFFKTLASESGQNQQLDIHRVNILASQNPQIFSLDITLRQGMKRAQKIEGRIEIQLSGIIDSMPRSLSWSELSGMPEQMVFSFKYFQRYAATIKIPEGFIPQKLILTIHSKKAGKKKSFERSFDWQQHLNQSSIFETTE